MEATGKIEKILPVVSGTTKTGDTWQKQTFLLRTEDEYDNLYPIEAFGKAMEHMGKIKVGDIVTAHFNIKCNEHQGRYYVALGLWKVETTVKAESNTPAQPKVVSKQEAVFEAEDDLGLPF